MDFNENFILGFNSHPRFPFCKRVSHFESDLQILYPTFHFCNDFPGFYDIITLWQSIFAKNRTSVLAYKFLQAIIHVFCCSISAGGLCFILSSGYF